MSQIFLEIGRGGIVSLCQVIVLLCMAPFLSWALESIPVLLSGRTVPPVRTIYRQFIVFIRHVVRDGLSPEEGGAFAIAMVVFAALPGFSFLSTSEEAQWPGPLGDLLLVGGLLLMGTFLVMPVVFVGRYIGAILTFCMIESLLVLAAPGVNGLSGLHLVLHLVPGSGLAGTSICCALALSVLSPLPTVEELTLLMLEHRVFPTRDRRDRHRMLLRFLQAGWLLLVADLLLPVLSGGGGWSSFIGLLVRVLCTLVVVVLLRLTGVERYPRLIALLIGLGFLIALAGRFAT